MNWFKKIWKALSEPVPPHKEAGDAPTTSSKAGLFRPTPTEETLSNFTPRAQQVLALSRKEADRLHHNFVGTEHLLLGLIALGQGVAVNVLQKMGLDLETVRMEVEKQVGTGPDQKMIGYIPYTPRVKKVLALADKERKALNHTYRGTEHILLGLLREGDGVAARVLRNLEVDIEQTRQEILKELDPNFQPSVEEAKLGSEEKTTIHRLKLESPQAQPPLKSQIELIDVTKRYDVYCSERNQDVVVYRNALFTGVRQLFTENLDRLADFFELEQSDGQKIFVAKYSVIKFCEPGTTPNAENVPGKQP